MTVNKSRWALAQEYEKEWWDSRSNYIDFDFYKHFADELLRFVEDNINITSDTKILEVGSGAGGILTYLKESNNRYAIDPLEYFYETVDEFSTQRDESVKYFTAKGENIPFEDNMFDLIIMDNVLDHCDKPTDVMKEITRVLKNNGVVYFKQNTYHMWGRFIRWLMEKFLIDRGHPFTFSKNDLKQLFVTNRLKVHKYKRTGYYLTWKKELFSKGIKEKIKAFLFVTRDKTTYLLQKF